MLLAFPAVGASAEGRVLDILVFALAALLA